MKGEVGEGGEMKGAGFRFFNHLSEMKPHGGHG